LDLNIRHCPQLAKNNTFRKGIAQVRNAELKESEMLKVFRIFIPALNKSYIVKSSLKKYAIHMKEGLTGSSNALSFKECLS